ncbi:hypothetical protein ABZ826_23440 [Streptomyces sp. NPDC047515]|uniref:hypothetical protein n=1 Tax=Streptomyces sp. NPDC047515 TaxID=3155380 RepID=UPI0034067AA9
MRPARFQDYTLDLAKNTPGTIRVQTLTEAGDTQHPYGLAITTSSGEARWQIIGQLAEGEKHDHNDVGVKDIPPPAGTAPKPGDHPEAWLAAVIAQTECLEIASIERWSTREGQDHQSGLTIVFHNTAKVFARQLR